MELSKNCDELVVLDFETTGLSAECDRIIEVGAIIVKKNKVIDTFSELMNPGRHLPYFITDLTGISASMLKGKPAPQKVMPKLKQFIGERTILAHNASFDSRFFYAEMARANLKVSNDFLCTMLLSRRLIPDLYNYKLGTLAEHLNIKIGRAHRALDDVKATAKLWDHLYNVVSEATGLTKVDRTIFKTIAKKPKSSIEKYLKKVAQEYLH